MAGLEGVTYHRDMVGRSGAGAERSTATVLFTDLVRSTELRSRLGEQAAEELRRKHDRLLTEAVEVGGGRVVKGLGDGIMATFPAASDAVAAAERIQQRWKGASAGERRVALLAGEPGVGKTRLAVELAARAHDEGATVLAGRCDEDLGVPYQPFVEAIRHFADHTPDEELVVRLG